jgi:DNA-binding transcriptional regulator YdaS (Cro superfamily)
MNTEQLAEAGRILFGAQWQTALSRMLGVTDRTMRRWYAGTSAVPPAVAETIRQAVEAKQLAAAVAAAGADIDDQAIAALQPYWQRGVSALLALGHHPAEIVAAGISLVVSAMQEGVGDEETARQLRQIADLVESPGAPGGHPV